MAQLERYTKIENVNTGEYCVFDNIENRALTIVEISKLENEYQKHLATINKSLNNKIMTGIELIAKERKEQIEKHGRTIEQDIEFNYDCQLGTAACTLCYEAIEEIDSRNDPPHNWDLEIWQKMYDKPYKERLIIAGALIAAELDRLNNL